MTEENKQVLLDYFSGKRILKPLEQDDLIEAIKERDERLINEYISKVNCCDECFASTYCTVNGLRKSRVPQEYCEDNIKSYFCDKARKKGLLP